MLNEEEQARLDKVKRVITKLKIRFANKEISLKTGFDKGYVSQCLKGKKPFSDNFMLKFDEHFKEPAKNKKVLLEEDQAKYGGEFTRGDLFDIIKSQQLTIQSQQETIHFLTVRGGNAAGRQAS